MTAFLYADTIKVYTANEAQTEVGQEMRFLKWVGCLFVSYIALLVFSAVFMGGAYMMILPLVAPIVGSILYRATTPPHEMEED